MPLNKDYYLNPLFHMGAGLIQSNQGNYGSMGGLAPGLASGMSSYGQARQQQQELEEKKKADQLTLMLRAQQEGRLQTELDQKTQSRQRAMDALRGMGNGFQGVSGPQFQGVSYDMGGFSPVANYNQVPGFDGGTRKLSSEGLQRILDIKELYPDLGKKLLDEAFDKPKYTTKTKLMRGKDGRKFWQLIGDDGTVKNIDVPQDVESPEDIKVLDLKDSYQQFIPGKGPVGTPIPKGIPQEQTPEHAARKAEAVEDVKYQAQQRKDAFKAIKLYNNMERDTKQVLNTVKEAKEMLNKYNVGFGAYAAGIPATDARAFKGKLTQLKANIAFQTLMKIKSQSVTGGALGQVSERELELLYSNLGALDQQMSQADLRKTLEGIETHLINSTKAIHGDIGAYYKGHIPKGIKMPEVPSFGADPGASIDWESDDPLGIL